MIERPERREGFARGHLLGIAFGSSSALPADAVAEGDLGGIFAPVARAGGADDVVLRRGQEALLGHFLEAALIVVVRPGLDVGQAAAEQPVGGAVSLVEEDSADTRPER